MSLPESYLRLPPTHEMWNRFFTIAPLLVVGSKEDDKFDLAPKHMATPMGFTEYFGFICTPRHRTYHNIKKNGFFTASFPMPNQVLLTSLAALPRCELTNGSTKPILKNIPTFKSEKFDAPYLSESYLCLGCQLYKIYDDFNDYSLITGKIEELLVHRSYIRSTERDDQELIYTSPLLAYLSVGRFAAINQSLAFPFPKDFKK